MKSEKRAHITNLPNSFECVKVSFSLIRVSDGRVLRLEPLVDKRLPESFNVVFFFFCEVPAERLASVKASTLSYWASGLVGCVLTIWVTSQWNIFSLKKLSVVFSDQYRLCSDMPVSFNMLSAASPRWSSNLLISEQTERLDCWTPLGPRRTVQNRTFVGILGDLKDGVCLSYSCMKDCISFPRYWWTDNKVCLMVQLMCLSCMRLYRLKMFVPSPEMFFRALTLRDQNLRFLACIRRKTLYKQ